MAVAKAAVCQPGEEITTVAWLGTGFPADVPLFPDVNGGFFSSRF
jgi:hypothetical protein